MTDELVSLDTGAGTRQPYEVLLEDRFDVDVAPGGVIGSRATSGSRRSGADREGTLSVDHGQLRLRWMAHAGWGRASLAYGPFVEVDGLVLLVRALNGLTTSQTDPRPEGGRAKVRRWIATFPRPALRPPRLADSMVIGWFAEAVPKRAPTPVAAVFHRAGEDASGELWFQVGARRLRLAGDLQNLPATYLIAVEDKVASLYAWSYPGAHGFAAPDDERPIAQLPLEDDLPRAAYAAVHQAVLGEVRYRVDTRVEAVRVLRPERGRLAALAHQLAGPGWWEPGSGPEVIADDFAGPAGDLRGSPTSAGGHRWERLLGEGVMERTGSGGARVRATVADPNPGRTVYGVPWDDPAGIEVATVVTPPGTGRGERHQGRSGLVVWQDPDNHLVINHFIDDGSVGVSISAFLRTRGEETMCEWDAVWTNVGSRVRWGEAFRLSVACDGRQFLCRVDGEPVLYRALTDYRSDAAPLDIRGAGLVANWEWGDDTGTRFGDFSVRPLRREATGDGHVPTR